MAKDYSHNFEQFQLEFSSRKKTKNKQKNTIKKQTKPRITFERLDLVILMQIRLLLKSVVVLFAL